MSDEIEKKDCEQWAEDWAGEADLAASRARMYAELAKRHTSTAHALNKQARRLNRTAVVILGALLVMYVVDLAFTVAEWWAAR